MALSSRTPFPREVVPLNLCRHLEQGRTRDDCPTGALGLQATGFRVETDPEERVRFRVQRQRHGEVLGRRVRDRRASYEQTLFCLDYYKKNYPHISTKTSLMVGLGETMTEIEECLVDLRARKVDIVTFGQYLRPTPRHLPVERYYRPEEFEKLKTLAYDLGFEFVASGPLVRSSYKARDYLDHLKAKGYEL